MKTSYKSQLKLNILGIGILTLLFICIQNISYADVAGYESVAGGQVNASGDDVITTEKETACNADNEESECNQSSYFIQFNNNQEPVLVKLYRKNIGHFMSLTQIPIRLFTAKQKMFDNEKNTDSEDWSSNINFDLSVGFLNNAEAVYPEQYIALSGHINRFNIMLVLILNS